MLAVARLGFVASRLGRRRLGLDDLLQDALQPPEPGINGVQARSRLPRAPADALRALVLQDARRILVDDGAEGAGGALVVEADAARGAAGGTRRMLLVAADLAAAADVARRDRAPTRPDR